MTAPVASPKTAASTRASASATGTSPLPPATEGSPRGREGQGEGKPSLTEHFATIASAPNGIKKLRELILELAVRGRLVPQSAEDEPAAKLLERINLQKTLSEQDSRSRKGNGLGLPEAHEVPFSVPSSWLWCRLGQIQKFTNGFAFKSQDFGKGGVGVIRIGDVSKSGEITTSGMQRLPLDMASEIDEKFRVVPGELVISMTGDVKLAFNNTQESFLLNQRVGKISPYFVHSRYVFFFMLTVANDKITNASGGVIPNVSTEEINETPISLPPLNEQYRIVEKVDELMALCDQLEAQQTDADAAQEKLVRELLATLTQSQSPADFQSNWQRLATHFDTLFTTESSIAALEKAVLQLAVMGKLVAQDSTEGNASEVLRKVGLEKERLVVEGKIRKPKILPDIESHEVPFTLPESWKWVRLGEVTSKITDGDHKTPPRVSEGFRLLSAKNVRDGYLDLDNCDFISREHYLKSRERCLPEYGDLLIVSVGGTIGRTSLIAEDSEFALVRSVALIKPLLLESAYLKYAMDSELLQSSIQGRKRGGAQPCLYLSEIEQFVFSLPPLGEQRRIVLKISELLGLCNQLKSRLADNVALKQQLADAMTEQALN